VEGLDEKTPELERLEPVKRKKEKRPRGRPKGSKTESIRVGYPAIRCPKCGSSERGAYLSTRRVKASGTFNGEPYNEVVSRRAKCRCGQVRIERSYELI
jgi:hypothetical protein